MKKKSKSKWEKILDQTYKHTYVATEDHDTAQYVEDSMREYFVTMGYMKETKR